ncbi:MAG TPA: hypothetical protein VNR41_01500 [Xanthobacteraceae bacterium]|jgi:hypothetical protein|nr:hypothetical protein [Xanthobacteraceae bacterium]
MHFRIGLRKFAAVAAAFPLLLANTGEASAHVKWFCAFNIAGQPRGLENVLCFDLEWLIALSVLWLLAGALFEATGPGQSLLQALNRVTAPLEQNTNNILRGTLAFFFISIWAIGGIILTPELKTTSPVIGIIQLCIVVCLATRKTLPLAGVGIISLFVFATTQYGVFHLADYPIFLGVAVYLILVGLGRDFFGIRPLDIVRWAAGITLMWASVEKWAYPEWSFPLLIQHPSLTLGFDPELFMRAAGAIEFALAFALVWTPLLARIAAIILTGMFVSAVFEFGKVDMIGHSAIIAVLVVIAADSRKRGERLSLKPFLVPAGYGGAFAATLFAYYAAHSLIYGSSFI